MCYPGGPDLSEGQECGVVMLAPPEEEEGEGEDIKDEGSGEEAGPGPP